MKGLHISKEELVLYGCVNCIWRLHSQCSYNLEADESWTIDMLKTPKSGEEAKEPIEGICPEYLNFLFSFAEEGDSINAMWEKFSLYVARLQSLNDYKVFLNQRTELEKLKAKGLKGRDLIGYEIKLSNLRLWWERLNDAVRKGYGRIADRESKFKEGTHLPGIMNARTINFNITNDKKKELEDARK